MFFAASFVINEIIKIKKKKTLVAFARNWIDTVILKQLFLHSS